MTQLIRSLQKTIQYNCDIADARYASDYSLCIYLLKMREYFRWETGKSYSDILSKEELGSWLCEKETQWEALEENNLQSIKINETDFDPYDAGLINNELVKHNYIYSSGLGLNCRPHFVLAKLIEHVKHQDYSLYICGKELARDLPSPPAFSINRNIFIRRDSIKRMVWEKIDEWQLQTNHNSAFQRVFGQYDIENHLDETLNIITDQEIKTLILHEIGEIHAGSIVGDEWHDMLIDLPRSPASFMVRSVRDHIADCYSTLPEIITSDDKQSLHFYFGNFTSIRKQIFPSLISIYQSEIERELPNYPKLEEIIRQGYKHWIDVAEKILVTWKKHGTSSAPFIESLIKNKTL